MKPESQPSRSTEAIETMSKRYLDLFYAHTYDLNFKLIKGICETIK